MSRALRAAAFVAICVLVAACGSNDDQSDTSTTTTVTSTSTTTTVEAPEDEPVETVGETSTQDVKSDGFPDASGEVALLKDVRVATHDGFDRVVFEFGSGDAPTYFVSYIDKPVREDGSGDVVEIAGDGWLSIQMTPASGVDLGNDNYEETYTGPRRIALSGGNVIEVVRTGDFEAHLTWTVGVGSPEPFAVTTLESPLRFVVDIEHQ